MRLRNLNHQLFAVVCFGLILLITSCSQKPTPIPVPMPATEPMSLSITIDMCQSHKPYEKRLFTYLDGLSQKLGKPVPIAVCVAGGWLKKHQTELDQIKNMNLDITWVNHSLTHPVGRDFLNNPKVNFKNEVYGNLALMKKYSLKPSKYFRFPGLIHNKKRLKELKEMGFTNLDADAWLTKGQIIKDGSIILVHGNGNEPRGVDLLLKYLKSYEKDILAKRLIISPLN